MTSNKKKRMAKERGFSLGDRPNVWVLRLLFLLLPPPYIRIR